MIHTHHLPCYPLYRCHNVLLSKCNAKQNNLLQCLEQCISWTVYFKEVHCCDMHCIFIHCTLKCLAACCTVHCIACSLVAVRSNISIGGLEWCAGGLVISAQVTKGPTIPPNLRLYFRPSKKLKLKLIISVEVNNECKKENRLFLKESQFKSI